MTTLILQEHFNDRPSRNPIFKQGGPRRKEELQFVYSVKCNHTGFKEGQLRCISKDYRKDPWIVPVTSLSSTSMEWRHVYTWPPLRLALKPPIAEVPPNEFLLLEGSLWPSIELFMRFVITVDGVAVGISSKTANCSPVCALHKCSEPSQDATRFPGNKQMSTTACTPQGKGVAQLVTITWQFL